MVATVVANLYAGEVVVGGTAAAIAAVVVVRVAVQVVKVVMAAPMEVVTSTRARARLLILRAIITVRWR
jgi:hypothetical protein